MPLLSPPLSGRHADPKGRLHPGAVVVDDTFVNIYGEVENTGHRWLHNIHLVITYYDVFDKKIYRNEAPAEIMFAGPGETAPYCMVTDKALIPGAVSHTIRHHCRVNDTPGCYLDVEFEDQGVSFDIGQITGMVRNTPCTRGPWLRPLHAVVHNVNEEVSVKQYDPLCPHLQTRMLNPCFCWFPGLS